MITFLDVDLVSPALVSGYQEKQLDSPPTLRPPSLRGQLRFWCRALSGPRAPWELETELFGAIERGQRIVVLPVTVAQSTSRTRLFPHKEPPHDSEMPALAPCCAFRLRFRIPRGFSEASRLQFQAVLWTWLHLGTIGRRARRGYGSLLWRPHAGDALEGFPVLDRSEALASRGDLEAYLRSGLDEVERRLGVPTACGTRSTGGWFRLQTMDQVFVGEPLVAGYTSFERGMEERLHGLRRRTAPGGAEESQELGRPPGPRLASPWMWRVFPAAGHGYFVVATWSPSSVAQLAQGSGIARYLRDDLGLSAPLAAGLPLDR